MNNSYKLLFLFGKGCKVETITLNVEAVNTHRDKPSLNSVSLAAQLWLFPFSRRST